MTDQQEPPRERRGVAARIGICLLNFAHPGLGLVRLGHYRTGLLLIGLAHGAMAVVLAYYALGPQLSYSSYVVIVAATLGAWLVAYGVAIVLSWRRSKRLEPRDGWLWRWYGVLGLAAALAGLWLLVPDFRSYYGSFHAVSESMTPTLRPGDRFIADMRGRAQLRRGDLAIVRSRGEDYVTRVAALPGDTIAMVDGVVLLGDKPVAQQATGKAGNASILREQFPGEPVAHAINDLGPTLQDNMPAVTLGPDEVFILGDNRDNALDSRFGEAMGGPGLVSRDRIKGRVLFRYWRSGEGLDGTSF